jgi:class I fructose-bisphosphate aldolase
MTILSSILNAYESDNPGVKANLYRLLTAGALGHTGKLMIYAVDQGFEHGPIRSFTLNPETIDPLYHFKFTREAKLSGFAAPLGLLETGAASYAGQIPLILKMNSSNLLYKLSEHDQAVTATVKDALRLGCVGVGFTIYPGSNASLSMFEELREIIHEAKAHGLFVIVWSYPRGHMAKEHEQALDVTSYGAHLACLLGAHIVKVKVPSADFAEETTDTKRLQALYDFSQLSHRISYVKKACFAGRRLVIFSGGAAKTNQDLLEEVQGVCEGGGDGSIVGRNLFQRSHEDALTISHEMMRIYATPYVA